MEAEMFVAVNLVVVIRYPSCQVCCLANVQPETFGLFWKPDNVQVDSSGGAFGIPSDRL